MGQVFFVVMQLTGASLMQPKGQTSSNGFDE